MVFKGKRPISFYIFTIGNIIFCTYIGLQSNSLQSSLLYFSIISMMGYYYVLRFFTQIVITEDKIVLKRHFISKVFYIDEIISFDYYFNLFNLNWSKIEKVSVYRPCDTLFLYTRYKNNYEALEIHLSLRVFNFSNLINSLTLITSNNHFRDEWKEKSYILRTSDLQNLNNISFSFFDKFTSSEFQKLKYELSKINIHINRMDEIISFTNKDSIPLLIEWLKKGIKDPHLKISVIKALSVKEAIGKSNKYLFEELDKLPKNEKIIRRQLGLSIYAVTKEDDINNLKRVILDKSNDKVRGLFVLALGKTRSKKVEDFLINLLNDEEVTVFALQALANLKSKNSLIKILPLTKHNNLIIKKQAIKSYKYIESN